MPKKRHQSNQSKRDAASLVHSGDSGVDWMNMSSTVSVNVEIHVVLDEQAQAGRVVGLPTKMPAIVGAVSSESSLETVGQVTKTIVIRANSVFVTTCREMGCLGHSEYGFTFVHSLVSALVCLQSANAS